MSFARIEAEEARQGIERVRQALQADLRQLDVAAEDYALWDDFYDFVKRDDPSLIEHFFSRAGLDNIDVDIVWVFDDSGRTRVQILADDPRGGLRALTPELLKSLQSYAALLREIASQSGATARAAIRAHAGWGDGGGRAPGEA